MTTLQCSRRGSRIGLRVLPAQGPAEEAAKLIHEATQRGREMVWEQAKALSTQSSPWDIEYFKAQLGEPELLLGGADTLAGQCETLADGQTLALPATPQTLQLRSLRQALRHRGLTPPSSPLQAWADRCHFAAATTLAAAMLLVYLLRFTRQGSALPATGGLLVAVHGEWSNRTRHLLGQIGPGLAPAAILLLGRPQTDLDTLRQTWTTQLASQLPPAVVPASAAAAWRALPQLLVQLRQGLGKVVAAPYRPPLREHAAIVFRVLLGGIMARWWQEHGTAGGTVLLGHTGTGDTVQLERALQRKGSRTVHVVHGLCTGPNFVGFSEQAIFRCGHDARQYSALQQYGHCVAPTGVAPALQRGEHGLLLLTNLAHPMNPGYRAGGIADELQVLQDTAALAAELGQQAVPLCWKPHPAIRLLPAEEQRQLRTRARALGFSEVTDQEASSTIARSARWVFTTPSTVAMDLLSVGCLPIVLDWQGTATEGALGQMPCRVSRVEDLRSTISSLLTFEAYSAAYHDAWQQIEPAHAPSAADLLGKHAQD